MVAMAGGQEFADDAADVAADIGGEWGQALFAQGEWGKANGDKANGDKANGDRLFLPHQLSLVLFLIC